MKKDVQKLVAERDELREGCLTALERLKEIEFMHIWESEDDEGYEPFPVIAHLEEVTS